VRTRDTSGFSLVETLVALALIATVSAALLPAIALAARLHRDSAIETEAAVIAAAHLARLAASVAASETGVGGSLDTPVDGWRADVGASGSEVDSDAAVFEVRSQVSTMPGGTRMLLIAVRVVPRAQRDMPRTFSMVVPDA
jgi:prepilin-type N-terminal cleavage/methylation domain-containing protein